MVSTSFGVSLIALAMITTLVILAVTSNVVLSLGMVGALSIVRFRSAIKEPMDIAFLFWAIAVGIVLAAGLIPLAVFGSLAIGVMLLIFVNRMSYTAPYIIVLHLSEGGAENAAMEFVRANTKKSVIKSKSVTAGRTEINMEVRLKDGDTGFVNQLCAMNGVDNAVLVSYNGDYMS